MESRNNTTVVLGSLRYKSAIDTDISLIPPFEQKQKELLEANRNSAISLNQIFDNERQQSTNFRFTFNVKFLYENDLIGIIQLEDNGGYGPFLNNLYYVNNTYQSVWYSGYPQSVEFDLIRNDVNNEHINFVTKSASTYNWNYFLSYGYKNDQTTTLQYVDSTNTITWTAGDGIPVFISRSEINGTNVIQFRTFVNHNLTAGEFVMLNGLQNQNEFVFNGTNVYEVYSLGNGDFASDEKIFNVIDVGYSLSLFNTQTALFKRVLDPNNLTETTSKYYVRKNKILTNLDDLTLTYNGYQNNSFKDIKKYEFSALTPDNRNRISIRNTNRTYNIINANDLNISGLTDNNGKPVSEIFLTFIHKGYMGWFNYPNIALPPQTQITPSALKKGWYFNITNTIINSWWENTNTLSDTNIPTEWYSDSTNTHYFFHNRTLNTGDIIDGDFCEYNDFEQKEYIISEHYHKIKYNPNLFDVSLNNPIDQNNLPGYYYQTHFPCKIRAFSPYIETGTNNSSTFFGSTVNYSGYTVVDIPPYSFYSNFMQEWRWRDVYTYGYIDSDGIGVDFPFLNKTHYPYNSIFFRLIPDQANYLGYSDVITTPIIDECE
jgi:hypothetical protein